MYIAGVSPAAIYGAEHEPWGEKDINRMVRQRPSSSGPQACHMPQQSSHYRQWQTQGLRRILQLVSDGARKSEPMHMLTAQVPRGTEKWRRTL